LFRWSGESIITDDKVRSRSLAIFYDAAYPFTDGGGQRRLYEIGRHMAAHGWRVHWYALKTWDGDPMQIREGIVYYGLKGHTGFYRKNGKRGLREALSYGRAVLTARADFGSYDLVWCGQWPLFHILALVARFVPWRTQMLIDWWEVWGSYWLNYAGWFGLGGWFLEFVITKAVTRLGHAVVDSTVGRDRVIALGVPAKALTLIPNGVDVAGLTVGESAEGASDIVYFGRLKGHKNVDHIVRALAILKNRDSRRLRLDLIGNGPERTRLEQLARTLGVADQIVFHGRVETDRAKALLKRSKVFVHASTQECGGSVNLLEANACGLPVVCYRHPMGIDPAQVIDGETGLMVSPAEPRFLAYGISEMLRLAATDNVRARCLAHVKSFDWSVIAERYRALIDDLLSAPRHRQANQSAELGKESVL
jgi:glycosyltransferase involved in cell wall biosynthesis